MTIKAVLRSADHPEYGEVAASFPIPEEDYAHTIELLEGLDSGDALRQDCCVAELDSPYPILGRLKAETVNVDELDYLAKRLDGFCKDEGDQFQALAHKLDLRSIQDLINLTFCCQRATVITDFSDLEKIGRTHRLNISGGTLPAEEYAKVAGGSPAVDRQRAVFGTLCPRWRTPEATEDGRSMWSGNCWRMWPPICRGRVQTMALTSPVMSPRARSGV